MAKKKLTKITKKVTKVTQKKQITKKLAEKEGVKVSSNSKLKVAKSLVKNSAKKAAKTLAKSSVKKDVKAVKKTEIPFKKGKQNATAETNTAFKASPVKVNDAANKVSINKVSTSKVSTSKVSSKVSSKVKTGAKEELLSAELVAKPNVKVKKDLVQKTLVKKAAKPVASQSAASLKRMAIRDEQQGALVRKWSSLLKKSESKGLKASNYNMNKQYEAQTPIQHKVLGWGYILNNVNDRLEVLFKDGVKYLISNYK